MADNTIQTGTDTIATDDLATLNGAVSSGVKVQRMKPGFGLDSDFTDVSLTNPLPVSIATTPPVQADIRDALTTSGADDGRTLFDLLDALGEQFVPIPMAPAGIERTGQQTAAQSLPVVLASDQVNDLTWQVSLRALPIGYNLLTGTPQGLDTLSYRMVYMTYLASLTTGDRKSVV